MIDNLKLTNFRKHTDTYITLTGGLNVIRGGNEGGKSTLSEALCYALFGARALREPLAETVTWGQPESSLKVVLNFTVDGVAYNIYRAKSGCELTYDGGRVTGQTDVTRFVENLFRVNADLAGKLFLANQNSLRGSLTAGPSATVEMIETLAGFSLMDDLIGKIQEQLPCGNTTQVEARIVQAQSALEAAGLGEEPVLEPGFALALADAERELARVKAALATLEVDSATRKVASWQNAEAGHRANVRALEQFVPVTEPAVPDVTAEQSQTLRAEVLKAKDHSRLRAEQRKVPPACEERFAGTRETLEEEVQETDRGLRALLKREQTLQMQIQMETQCKVNEDSCAFCKKSLKDVPEVALTNARQDGKIAALLVDLAAIEPQKRALEDYLREARLLLQVDTQVRIGFTAPLWSLDTSLVPAVPTWAGGVVPEAGEAEPDYKAMADRIDRTLEAYVVAKEQHAASLRKLADLRGAVNSYVSAEPVEAMETLRAAESATHEVQAALAEQAMRNSDYRVAKARFEAESKAYLLAQQTRASAQTALESSKAELSSMVLHNELIKKIRVCRPVVAANLWGAVLASISHYFSKIRGEPSVVTRAAGGFSVNGRGVAGLSGSTLDSLGLALRLAVTKTFLPNLDFLLLDEAAAACDADREVNMLGVIASSEFPQSLVITHSDLADAFAANLIQL